MKLKTFFIHAMMVMFSCGSGVIVAAPPLNMTCAKKAIVSYYDSGAYLQDVSVAVKKADDYLDHRLEQNKKSHQTQKLAMVLDIDETSVSNYESIKQRDFTNDMKDIVKSYQKADAPAIAPTLQLYKKAKAAGVEVFFITFRPAYLKAVTAKNLKNAGYAEWNGLFLPSDEQFAKPANAFKTAVRQNLEKQGYHIILSLGDQDSDLEGGHAEYVVKLPNPLYTSSSHCDTIKCSI